MDRDTKPWRPPTRCALTLFFYNASLRAVVVVVVLLMMMMVLLLWMPKKGERASERETERKPAYGCDAIDVARAIASMKETKKGTTHKAARGAREENTHTQAHTHTQPTTISPIHTVLASTKHSENDVNGYLTSKARRHNSLHNSILNEYVICLDKDRRSLVTKFLSKRENGSHHDTKWRLAMAATEAQLWTTVQIQSTASFL